MAKRISHKESIEIITYTYAKKTFVFDLRYKFRQYVFLSWISLLVRGYSQVCHMAFLITSTQTFIVEGQITEISIHSN